MSRWEQESVRISVIILIMPILAVLIPEETEKTCPFVPLMHASQHENVIAG